MNFKFFYFNFMPEKKKKINVKVLYFGLTNTCLKLCYLDDMEFSVKNRIKSYSKQFVIDKP